MIIFDRNSKSLDIPVGLGNLEVNVVTPASPGDIVESAVTEANQYTDEQVESALTEAKGYTDTQIEGLDIPKTYVLNLMTNEERAALYDELVAFYPEGSIFPSSGFPAERYNFYCYFNSGQDGGNGFIVLRLDRKLHTTITFEGIRNGYVGRNFKELSIEILEDGRIVGIRENYCSVYTLNGQKGELNLKTINNESILGEGNIEIQGGGATTGEVQTMIDTAIGAETARTENTYLKQGDLNGYATKNWVEGKGYVTSADTADFVTSAQTKTQIEGYHYTTSADTAQAISSSLTEYYTSGQTDEKIQDAVSGIDLSDYYTSAQTDNKISSALTDYYTSGQTNSAISTATQNMVTSTAVNNIWVGTTAQYNAITTKDPNTLYFINNN